MDKLKLRREIIEAGKAKLKTVVHDFQERIDELKAVTIGNDMQETASQSESRKDSDIELLDTLATQLDFAQGEINTLDLINPDQNHSTVEFGSVVITDKRNLFVSTGIEEFEAHSKLYFGISTQAPLYKNMAGQSVGAHVKFNGIEYKILEIF